MGPGGLEEHERPCIRLRAVAVLGSGLEVVLDDDDLEAPRIDVGGDARDPGEEGREVTGWVEAGQVGSALGKGQAGVELEEHGEAQYVGVARASPGCEARVLLAAQGFVVQGRTGASRTLRAKHQLAQGAQDHDQGADE